MLYGIEINEWYQVQSENKFRCWLSVGEDEPYPVGPTSRPHRVFASENQSALEELAELLPESYDARVEPVDTEEGQPVVFGNDKLPAVKKAFTQRAREASRQSRQIR